MSTIYIHNHTPSPSITCWSLRGRRYVPKARGGPLIGSGLSLQGVEAAPLLLYVLHGLLWLPVDLLTRAVVVDGLVLLEVSLRTLQYIIYVLYSTVHTAR